MVRAAFLTNPTSGLAQAIVATSCLCLGVTVLPSSREPYALDQYFLPFLEDGVPPDLESRERRHITYDPSAGAACVKASRRFR
jgi:hypothetical protein